ncbi:MAG TPA: PilZ domain-containing protein [Nitrospira sp.]|nr:PilZ domain-containing protein [Nitrospira sp.]
MMFHSNKRTSLRVPIVCAVYYSDGQFHASGLTTNLAPDGSCLHGSHQVTVGMVLTLLVIPPTQDALLIKRATVRWTRDRVFGVQLDTDDKATSCELEQVAFDQQHVPLSFMTH